MYLEMAQHTMCGNCGYKFRPDEETVYHSDASGNNDTWSTHKKCPKINIRMNIRRQIDGKEKELVILYQELVKNG